MSHNDGGVAVINAGSTLCKVGFSGSDLPLANFPTVIGRPKNSVIMKGIENPQELYIGDDALALRGVLTLNHPIERSRAVDWDDMAKIWEYAMLEQLRCVPTEHPVLIADAPGSSSDDREKTAEYFFETLSVPSLYIGYEPVLSLHAAGRSTGVVVSSGGSVTTVSAVYEGYLVPNALQSLSLGGTDVTARLQGLLEKRGASFDTHEARAVVEHIKTSLTYIALDYQAECKTAADSFQQKRLYELPDGTTVVLREERFSATEGVFQPSLHGQTNSSGVHEMVQKCIKACDEDFISEMSANIVLAGGNTLLPCFPERLQQEVTSLLAQSAVKVRVEAPVNRKDSAWVGGSVLAAHSSFARVSVSRAEYEEVGPSVVRSKFL